MAKDAKDIEKTVIQILADKLDIDAKKIKPESKLADDLGMDSFMAVEFAFDLEEEFCMKIPQEELKDVRTVEDIVEFINKKSGADKNEKSK